MFFGTVNLNKYFRRSFTYRETNTVTNRDYISYYVDHRDSRMNAKGAVSNSRRSNYTRQVSSLGRLRGSRRARVQLARRYALIAGLQPSFY